ncbi:hypothetical protein QVD17_11147 [Tagetes erecta]|uniref:Uncharacterized protein n=1 Tax=Tagetes erecta TaxID=13708 RepID=A0AAD8L718_TARER|nr:hypothetical protein QVD17_11147 [Tagetes erecta]
MITKEKLDDQSGNYVKLDANYPQFQLSSSSLKLLILLLSSKTLIALLCRSLFFFFMNPLTILFIHYIS